MKQPEDTKTMDMYGEPDSATTRQRTDTYKFYTELANGETVWWTGLSFKQARDMNAYTYAHMPSNVVAFGWEKVEQKQICHA